MISCEICEGEIIRELRVELPLIELLPMASDVIINLLRGFYGFIVGDSESRVVIVPFGLAPT